jgi:hypothetical protein
MATGWVYHELYMWARHRPDYDGVPEPVGGRPGAAAAPGRDHPSSRAARVAPVTEIGSAATPRLRPVCHAGAGSSRSASLTASHLSGPCTS